MLVEIGKAHKCSAARVALAWLLKRPGVSSVIIGGRTEEQFADNLAAADLKLSDEETKRLEEASRPPLLYPYWHQAWTAKDRLGAADLALLGPYLGDVVASPRNSHLTCPAWPANVASRPRFRGAEAAVASPLPPPRGDAARRHG